MALPSNPTVKDIILAIRELENSGGSSIDVQVDSVSIVSNDVADLQTIDADYNASTNKLATNSNLPYVIKLAN